jgi:hypothetical protein
VRVVSSVLPSFDRLSRPTTKTFPSLFSAQFQLFSPDGIQVLVTPGTTSLFAIGLKIILGISRRMVQHAGRQFSICERLACVFALFAILFPGSGERMIIGCRHRSSRNDERSHCKAFHSSSSFRYSKLPAEFVSSCLAQRRGKTAQQFASRIHDFARVRPTM